MDTSVLTNRKFVEGVSWGAVISALTAFAPSERARLIVARPIPEEPPVFAHEIREGLSDFMVSHDHGNCTCDNDHLVLQTSQVLVFDLEFSHASKSSRREDLFLKTVKFEEP